MEELIKNIILNSESDTGFIGDAVEIGNVVLELLEDGVEFYLDYEEIDEMIDNNDILQITKTVCEDCGTVDYLLEEVFDEEGYTIEDELNTLYIDADLIDCVELEAYGETEIIVVELEYEDDEDFDEDYCDCENCNKCSYEDEEFDDEEAIEDIMFDELMSSIEELDIEDDDLVDNIFDLIKDKIAEAFAQGYNEGVLDSADESLDTVEAIKSLIIE